MHNIGELIIYSGHGICRIDNICEKTFAGRKKTYYVLHPIENSQGLTINAPVDNEKNILKLMDKEEAETIIASFHTDDGADWIEKAQLRHQTFSKIINSGNRKEISRVANALIRKKIETEINGKKFYENDSRLLKQIENILFKELAIALDLTEEEVRDRIYKLISEKVKI